MKLKGPKSYAREWFVNGEMWTLKFVNKVDGSDSLGLCDPSDKTFYIKKGQGKKEMLKTFFHEKIHVAEEEYDFTISHAHVYKLEEFLFDLIINNYDSLKKLLA